MIRPEDAPRMLAMIGIGELLMPLEPMRYEMPRCRDCRWWDHFEEDDPGSGICELFYVGTPYTDPRLYRLFNGKGDNHLVTGELFGCVRWEARE